MTENVPEGYNLNETYYFKVFATLTELIHKK